MLSTAISLISEERNIKADLGLAPIYQPNVLLKTGGPSMLSLSSRFLFICSSAFTGSVKTHLRRAAPILRCSASICCMVGRVGVDRIKSGGESL